MPNDELHQSDPDAELLRPRLSPAAQSYLDGTGGAIMVEDTATATPVGVLELAEGQIRWTELPEAERVGRIVDIASRYGMGRADLYILLACGVRHRLAGG